jgi:hypothetical protein
MQPVAAQSEERVGLVKAVKFAVRSSVSHGRGTQVDGIDLLVNCQPTRRRST